MMMPPQHSGAATANQLQAQQEYYGVMEELPLGPLFLPSATGRRFRMRRGCATGGC